MTLQSIKAWLTSKFELSDHNRRLSSMEGLRGLAILLVFACHYDGIIGLKLNLTQPFDTLNRVIGMAGGTGVDLFFLLSGFLIYRTTLKPALNLGAFWARRAERIYPTFLAVFAIYLLLGAVHLAPVKVPSGALGSSLAILANLLFLPGMFDIPAVISAAWSLSYEWFFYLVLPLAVIVLQLRRWTRGARVALFGALIAGYVGACLLAPSMFPTFANYDGSHVRMISFLSGMTVYELLESQRFRDLLRPPVEIACVVVAVAAFATMMVMMAVNANAGPPDGEWLARSASFEVIPTFVSWAALGLVVLRDDGWVAGLFKATWLRWTGNISYSFYLVHSIPMHFVAAVIGRPATHVNGALLYAIALPITVAITYAVSALLFVMVEKPLSLRPRRSRRPAPAERQVA